MTDAFVVKFTRCPASEGINEGTNGGVNEGISQLLEYIRKNPSKRVVEIAAALDVPSKTIQRWIKKLRERGKGKEYVNHYLVRRDGKKVINQHVSEKELPELRPTGNGSIP
jgi:DNA-binding MarR family transcriptional regulator